jgi:hypothetical protein
VTVGPVPEVDAGQVSLAGPVRVALSLRLELWAQWGRLREAFGRSGLPGSFVAFLCRATWDAWRGEGGPGVAYQAIYIRDRFRCANPTCRRRDVPHHIRFRSRGGGEEDGNLISLCTICHLDLLHQGRIQCDGDRPLVHRGGRAGGRQSSRWTGGGGRGPRPDLTMRPLAAVRPRRAVQQLVGLF